jgi:hypothetical protein
VNADNRRSHPEMPANPSVMLGESPPKAVHAATRAGEASPANGGAEHAVDERRAIERRVHRILDQHREQTSERLVFVKSPRPESVAHRPFEIARKRKIPKPEGMDRSSCVRERSDREPYAATAGIPEDPRDSVEECPKVAMSGTITKTSQPLVCPERRLAMEHDLAVGKPADVTRKNLPLERRHPDGLEQLTPHTSGFEVDQRRGSNIESKPGATKEASATPWQPMGLENERSKAHCLKASRGSHSCNTSPNDGDVIHVRSSRERTRPAPHRAASFQVLI